ncbi:MAG: hypothetical protein JXA04_11910 [Gammaproteobacteria bacterium]|nr:hypothetical protein [Gammaproteobacteria bacterium]
MKEKVLHAIYCDDIRQEAGNKISLMGCYGPVLCVPEIPATLPKLCVFATLLIPINEKADNIVMKLLVGGEEKATCNITLQGDALGGIPAKYTSLQTGLTLNRFEIKSDCTHLRIIAEIGGSTVEGPGLVMRSNKEIAKNLNPLITEENN